MTTKLTLSIDKEVIKQAKKLSRRKGKSLSKIVEDYLRNISSKNVLETGNVQRLSGLLKNKIPSAINAKEIKGKYLKNKYEQ